MTKKIENLKYLAASILILYEIKRFEIMTTKMVASAIGFMAINFMGDEIKTFVRSVYNNINDMCYVQLHINTNTDPLCVYASKTEIVSQCTITNLNLVDGVASPQFDVAVGRYYLSHTPDHLFKKICVDYDDQKMTIKMLWGEMNELKDFIESIYRKYCSSENVVKFYGLDELRWDYPVLRKPRNLDAIQTDVNLKKFVEEVDLFIRSEQKYALNDFPYHAGYLLVGDMGKHKSKCVEIIAAKFSRCVYLLDFNVKDITDASLKKLCMNIPANSIISIDEIEKQLELLFDNSHNKISYGGILAALDGPQRLSHGTIVIMTANKIDSINPDFMKNLIRPGRIDKVFMFE